MKRGSERPHSDEQDIHLRNLWKHTLDFHWAAVVLIPLDFWNELFCFQLQLLTLETENVQQPHEYCINGNYGNVSHQLKLLTSHNSPGEKKMKQGKVIKKTHMGGKLQRKKSFDDVICPAPKKNIRVNKENIFYHLNTLMVHYQNTYLRLSHWHSCVIQLEHCWRKITELALRNCR